MGGRISNWGTPSMREFIFWREGMSPEEFEQEREYYYQNLYTAVRDGTYLPLWKQELQKRV